MANQVFSSFKSFQEVTGSRRVRIAQTNKGAQLLTIDGQPAATIKRELQGSTIQETAKKLAAVNLVFGMPQPGAKDLSGRDSLPCLMEAKTQWSEVEIG